MAFSAFGQQPTLLSKEKFADRSYARLSYKTSAEEIQPVKETVINWKATKSEKDWVKLTDTVYHTAALTHAKSEVLIKSSAGPGASVKYQTIGERERGEPPTSAKGLTEVKESMLMGMYHIWTERSGKATSDKNARFPIVNAIEKVDLPEQ